MSGSKRKSALSSKKIRAWARENLRQSEESFAALPNKNFRESFLARLSEVEAVESSEAPKVAWGNFESASVERAVLVVPFDCPDGGDEMQSLCRTLGIEVVATQILAKNRSQDPATFVGSGTVEKIQSLQQAHRAGAAVFDHGLTPGQIRNLEDRLKGPVLDRQGVILEIFKYHAKSKLAKLQVEVAHLKYLQPRLSGIWMGLSRQSGGQGGLGGRGLGETRLELDRRVVKDRIASLTKKLREAEKSFATQSSRRSHFPRVALVGYTNSGKSTLMNVFTRAGVESKDELFHTLDTTVRPLQPLTQPKILISDTVGFVRDLPHDLVASFKSTLREAVESRLLIVVLDASDDLWRDQYEVTSAVLADIGADQIPRLIVFNKADKVAGWARVRLGEMKRHFRDHERVRGVLLVSALQGEGLAELRTLILEECGAAEAPWNQASPE